MWNPSAISTSSLVQLNIEKDRLQLLSVNPLAQGIEITWADLMGTETAVQLINNIWVNGGCALNTYNTIYICYKETNRPYKFQIWSLSPTCLCSSPIEKEQLAPILQEHCENVFTSAKNSDTRVKCQKEILEIKLILLPSVQKPGNVH